ncbi:class I adenylate-forming enzyme family protein, partial [Actinocorallia lasiicapitis]
MASSPFSNYAYAILTANALRTPDKVALTYCGTQSFTYDELNREVNRVAHALAAAGVGAGTRVASLVNETLAVARVYLAQMKIGSVVAALNPYWPAETLQAVVESSEATVFVYDSSVQGLIDQVKPNLTGIKVWIDVADLDTAGASDAEPEYGGHGNDLLALFYTSGTTGLPKPVMHTHFSALSVAQIWTDVETGEDSVTGTGAIIWGIGFPALVGPTFYAGQKLVLEQDWGPVNFLTVVPREKVTHVSLIPSFFSALLGDDDHLAADLSSLRAIILGGEPLLPAVRDKIKARFPDAAIYSYYGQTEAPYTVFGRQDDGSQPITASGRARLGCAVKVTDPDGNRLVGEVGEINLTGPNVTAGYDRLPAKTAESLKDGWFIGGDLGVLSADGVLSVLGRRDDAILKGGQWSQPAQVEEKAVEVAGVAEAGAVGVPAHTEGADAAEQRILLAVVPRAGAVLDAEAV